MDHVAQLCRRKEELDEAGADVLVISFGTAELARAWQAETCPSFQVMLDPERKAYRNYDLERSRWRSSSPGTLWFTLKSVLGGRKWHGITADPAQLGGDFIIGADGLVKLAYPSHDPLDRPGVEEILSCLRRPETVCESGTGKE
ncbi:MAG: AhpC/TSA family protein [Dehalogenimonas sp.]